MKANVMEGMEYMEQKYIDEAVEYKAKTRNVKPLMRWGAIAACLVLVVGLCLGFLGGKEEIVLPPSRYGANAGQLSIYCPSFEEAWDTADAVAWVRVGNWMGERTGDEVFDTTYFEAEVIQAYKGDPGDSIVLEQVGSSHWTIARYPLFTHGNELLVFLQGGESRPFDSSNYTGTAFNHSYYIIGTYGNLMDVVRDSDGKIYVVDWLGNITEDFGGYALKEQDADDVRLELSSNEVTADPIQRYRVNNAVRIFSLEVMEGLLTDE